MTKIRVLVPAAIAALVLGTASAFAMTESASGGDANAHGMLVSSAARTCPHNSDSASGERGVHGACVSAIASANGQAHRNGAGAANVKDCNGQGLTGRDFGACVSGNPKAAAPHS
jgi:hypothetical protein